jgi:SAM-dependent methyltransferase
MTTAPPSPLATPEPWDLVSDAYAAEVLPEFSHFAAHALDAAKVGAKTRVLDVACGPGTLTLLAARRGARVDALDFSPKMIAQLRAQLERESLEGVRTEIGDGQALPFESASYDAAFSMFGLMFFPDRARGFAELHRCLKDGGVAVVSSWQPMEATVPFLASLFDALRTHIPGLPFGSQEAPLAKEDVFRSELEAARFHSIEVRHVAHAFTFPSTADAWASFHRTMAPLVMLARKMGPAWPPIGALIERDLIARYGAGAQTITMPAWLGIGRK